MSLPIGTVTFLFSDIQGSTSLWENHPEEMRVALARHDVLMRSAIESNEGIVFKTIGDAFCAAFATAADGISAAMDAQKALHAENWNPAVTLRVRMGLHTGSVEHRDNDYFGPPLNRVARLMSIGHGSQVLVSAATQELVRDSLPPQVSLHDMGPHRLKDLIRAEVIYQVQHPDLPSQFPPLRSLNNPELPNNLPQQVTSFIGREKEMSEVKQKLTSTRLLTLLASGGTGKSRLSLQIAADMLDEYPDGVWFIELAGFTEPALVASTVARILNIGETPDSPTLLTLTKALKPRRLMLILDNCEHLIAACAEIANALLRNCPNVTILASSREAMNITGELVYPLHALALPDPKARHSIHSLAQYDAVRLFVDRASLVRPDFAVTNQNAASLAQLCHRLDGIPLALELAAARVRSLPVEEINGRLDNRFRLLTGGSRNVLPRQQTLRALIDWSYDLLNEQEQALFARLSVFSGGWTLAAAEAICTGDLIEDWEVFDLLTALADKSLAVCETDNEETRYRLLETLREYGREKLAGMQDAEAFVERHAQYYVEALEEKSKKSGGVEEGDFPWLMSEADNIRATIEWLWKADKIEAAASISVDLRLFWFRKGWFREASGYLMRVVSHIDALADMVLKARVLKDAGWFAYLLGDLNAAEKYTQESVETTAAVGATELQATYTNNLALIVQSRGEYPRSEALFIQAIELLRSQKNETDLADCLMNLGMLQSMQEKHGEAQKLFAEAKSIYEHQSNTRGMAAWLCGQSDLALRQSNWQEAQSLAEQSLERFRGIDHRIGVVCALANLAKADSRLGNYGAVDASIREAFNSCMDINFRDLMPILLITQSHSNLLQGNMEQGVLLYAGAVRLRTLLNIPISPEEQEDLTIIADMIKGRNLEELLTVKRQQLLAMNIDVLLTHMLSHF